MAILAALMLALGCAGCVDGDASSIYIVGNATLDDECIIQEDPLLAAGQIDTAFGSDYTMHLIVENQILRRSTPVGADPSGVHFTHAEITLQDVTGADIGGVGTYSAAAGGFIPSAEDSSSPGRGWVVVSAVPAEVVASLEGMGNTTIQLAVKLFGETNGQLEVETSEWLYVVEVCAGCLACVGVEDRETSCNPGQDGEGYRTDACPPM
ncbi:MAG: hypothetical protein ACOCV4_05320 [Myxococcota bacterium]